MVIKKIGEDSLGVYSVKSYLMQGGFDPVGLIRRLQAGSGKVQEVISYVFEGADPLGLDARSFSPEEFFEALQHMGGYGSGLGFDVVVQTEGPPVTVELTKGEEVIVIKSLDSDAELEDLLGPEPEELSVPEKENLFVPKIASEEERGQRLPAAAAAADRFVDSDPAAEEDLPQEVLSAIAAAKRHVRAAGCGKDSNGCGEGDPEKSRRMALTALYLSETGAFWRFDMNRVIRMCLIHGAGEAFWKEVPAYCADIREEMRAMRTPEAKLYRAIEKSCG